MSIIEMPKIESCNYPTMPIGNINFNNKIPSVIAEEAWSTLLNEKYSKKEDKKEENMSKRRIVNVYVVDTDESIDLKNAVLYTNEGLVTEDIDEDIMYELDIKGILEKHNRVRLSTINEKASLKRDKDIYLKEIKASGLSIKIVTMVQF